METTKPRKAVVVSYIVASIIIVMVLAVIGLIGLIVGFGYVLESKRKPPSQKQTDDMSETKESDQTSNCSENTESLHIFLNRIFLGWQVSEAMAAELDMWENDNDSDQSPERYDDKEREKGKQRQIREKRKTRYRQNGTKGIEDSNKIRQWPHG